MRWEDPLQARYYYVFDGVTIRVATWDERCAADLWEDLGCAPKSSI